MCRKALYGVADGARTHDNRNHNPEFIVFANVDWCGTIYINQQLTKFILFLQTVKC